MNQNKKLQQLRQMVRADFKRLDTALEKLCRPRRCKAEDVADAFLEELGLAVQEFIYDPDDRQFAATTREFRELVAQALMPGIERRIAAYRKRFPKATAVFEQCQRKALEMPAGVIHPADTNILTTATPGRYEACYWPERGLALVLRNDDVELSSFAVLRFSAPGTSKSLSAARCRGLRSQQGRAPRPWHCGRRARG